MYQLVQFIRHKIPLIWNLIDIFNGRGFQIRYKKRLKTLPDLLASFSNSNVNYSLARTEDAPALEDFFQKQPKEAFKYFKPHEFDKRSIIKLINNPSFIMILAKCQSSIIGYSFLRCFANGKSFRGKIVDINFRGQGIAKNFGIITTEIASKLGIGLFGTISKMNISSMASSKSSNEIKVIKELPEDYLLIQYLPKKHIQ